MAETTVYEFGFLAARGWQHFVNSVGSITWKHPRYLYGERHATTRRAMGAQNEWDEKARAAKPLFHWGLDIAFMLGYQP